MMVLAALTTAMALLSGCELLFDKPSFPQDAGSDEPVDSDGMPDPVPDTDDLEEADDQDTDDLEPPSTPRSLEAFPLSPTRILIRWLPSTDNVGVAGYNVFRDDGLAGSVADAPFDDSALAQETAYAYRVSAFDDAGNESPPSDPVAASTWAESDKRYTIMRADDPVTIDGSCNEFGGANVITIDHPATQNSGRYMFLWDDAALHACLEVQDDMLEAIGTERDGDLWVDDCIELCFDTLHDATPSINEDDFKFFVNVLNVQRDSHGSTGGEWSCEFQSEVRTDGTVNEPTDDDVSYAIEFSLPWESLEMDPPAPGTTWGMELTMDDRDNDVRIPVVWSVIEALHINDPEHWGDAVFHQ